MTSCWNLSASTRGFSTPDAFLQEYDILECLAHTERGETLLVQAKGDEKQYIAKVCRGATDQEGALLRKLSHPALPSFVAAYAQNGVEMHLREYVVGVSLEQAARQCAFAESDVIDVGLQMCDVLGYLHSRKPPIIHRDVKPANVIMREDGSVALIDLGISRLYKRDAAIDTIFAGTDRFAPPEQYGFAQTDARSDIYSLGALLRYLLLGGKGEEPEASGSMRRILRRCMRFSPKDRYSGMPRLRAALRWLRIRRMRAFRVATAATALTLAAFLTFGVALPTARRAASRITFEEPSIEQAVRLVLDKPDGMLTQAKLDQVTELYLVRGKPSRDETAYDASNLAYNTGDSTYTEKAIVSLEDVRRMPNLRVLFVGYNDITDISPLANLTKLQKLELRFNQIEDLQPLRELVHLEFLGLSYDPVTDIAPLAGLTKLDWLDLTSPRAQYDPAPIAQMGDISFLSMGGCPTAYRYMAGKRVSELRLDCCEMDTLDWLSEVEGITSLTIDGTRLTSLEGIERHAELTELNIANTDITDLSPLRKLPKLFKLTLSEDMRPYADVLKGWGILQITYL